MFISKHKISLFGADTVQIKFKSSKAFIINQEMFHVQFGDYLGYFNKDSL